MRKIFIVLIAIITSSIGNAQIDLSEPDRKNCGTAILNNQLLLNNPAMQLEVEEKNKFAKEFAKSYVSDKAGPILYTIPVVYHVIHDNGSENVSKAVIEASMKNLNDDYQTLNADLSQVVSSFTGIIADIQVQFRLAHLDPNGNCTEGITRTVSPLTYAMDDAVKSLVRWDPNKYLNIWVGQTIASGAGGYSYYPSSFDYSYRGIVIRSEQLGNSITHEVGHFLDLPHLWGSSNTPGVASNCGLDDGIADTPQTLGNTSCITTSATCNGSLDNVQNYMEYSGCSRMFTEGQKLVMHAALNSSIGSRNTLWAPANLTATGVADPYGVVACAPVAGFNYNRDYICEGASVTFTDDSYNAIPTTWNWTFAGGTPATSGVANPTIVYNTEGVYSVTHQPGTVAGSGSNTKNNIITVSSLVADYSGAIIEGFESLSQINTDWIIENEEGFGWEKTTLASTSGSSSMRIRNYSNGNDTKVDVLISPSYDLSSVATKTMTFKQAFAKKISSDGDRLYVYSSVDCGETWAFGLLLTSANLPSVNSTQTANFVPVASDWLTRTIDLSSISTATNVRFKFEFKSGGGNNIYIDDINIGGAVGVAGFSNVANFKIYPNPTNSSAQISFNLVKDVKALSIKVRNAVGQEITSVINQQAFNAGTYNLKIDEERKLASGIYFVEFNADNNIKVQKLIVQ